MIRRWDTVFALVTCAAWVVMLAAIFWGIVSVARTVNRGLSSP